MTQDFWEWYEKNKWELFWRKYRYMMGLDPEGKSFLREKQHWKRVRKSREVAFSTDNPYRAFDVVHFIDEQALLKKWWNELDRHEKEKYLIRTWFDKMDGYLYGLNWWIPYFEDLGYITNCDMPKPDSTVVLYRGAEPFFRDGMSWTDNINMAETFADSFSVTNKFVYATVAHPESILAIFKGNAVNVDGSPILEHGLEYVINHNDLSLEDIYAVDDPEWQKRAVNK